MPIELSVPSNELLLGDLFSSAVSTIDTVFPRLARSHQSALLDGLKTGEPGETFDDAMQALQASSTVLEQFNDAARSQLQCFGALAAPLFCWGLLQPWATNQPPKKLDDFVSIIADRLGAGRYKAKLASVNALAQLALPILSTRLAMSASKKTRVGLMFFEAATKALGNCTSERQSAVPARMFVSLGLLASRLDKQELGNKTVVAHWENHLKTWFAPKTSDAATVSLDTAAPVLASILQSPLPSTYKLRAAAAMNEALWLHPLIIEPLREQLPTKESSRLAFLPIERNGANARAFNQNLVRTYCPQLNVLLELVAGEDDWSSKGTLRSHVRQMESKQATFELPMEFEA